MVEPEAVFTLDQIESIVARLKGGGFEHPIGALRYQRGEDGLWYVFDSAGAVVFIADDTGYMQLTGEEPPKAAPDHHTT